MEVRLGWRSLTRAAMLVAFWLVGIGIHAGAIEAQEPVPDGACDQLPRFTIDLPLTKQSAVKQVRDVNCEVEVRLEVSPSHTGIRTAACGVSASPVVKEGQIDVELATESGNCEVFGRI